ncbi:hypothetical protein J0895_04185 [Phormidium pseudopriestleyi FRX01]|uniref:Uncharacterized protein n=1 Tax=Phormidium pseudopriestleyi FRX01 TaxID=1759528 RepID=A0ABS3FMI6_9CYAN|nr:hypothetical protein [Phormidium pseudopriestleyi]MBO0348315.1 hypothetical protein [Phormidium pseudopriestleyi FRX01]
MDNLTENQGISEIGQSLTDKIKQRQALEDAYSNFVEPYLNQRIEVKLESSCSVAVSPVGFYYASAWLLLVMLYAFLRRGYHR